MKINKQSVSGTGNGVNEEMLLPFVEALKDFEKLIRSIHTFYSKKPTKSFSGGKFHLLNNWKGEYKIELRNEEFPFHLCNGIDVYYCGWNDVILSCKFPLKFKAPTFSGGETDDMSVVLTTQVSLYKNNVANFMENKSIPKHIKIEVLKGVKEAFDKNVKTRYEEDVKFLIKLAEQKKLEIKNSEESIELNTIEIPEIEGRIKEITKILNDKLN